MRLSQGQLNLLETCPRKFQHTYLDLLGSPVSPEQQDRIAWGSRFHLLMQQRELGLPVDSLLLQNPELERYFNALITAAPEIFANQPEAEIFRGAEHQRTLNFGDYLLTVRYDLLIAYQKNAKIIDWKTYPLPQNKTWLERDWQTRLYLYLLAETSEYLPKEISMAYWFVKAPLDQPDTPAFVKFAYSEAKHKKTHEDLTQLLENLTGWLKAYQEKKQNFPQVNVESKACDSCQYDIRCQRDSEKKQEDMKINELPELANIEEVAL